MPKNYHSQTFHYERNFSLINFREHPERYQIGRGEQGVLLVEPYKSEILPSWKFKTPEIATASAQRIYQMFLDYKKRQDFVGMDMSRKFLQMGYTRSRRYANHLSGKKYVTNPQHEEGNKQQAEARKHVIPQEKDALTNEKAQSARIFYEYYMLVKTDTTYIQLKEQHRLVEKQYLNSHTDGDDTDDTSGTNDETKAPPSTRQW
jgi:hypothetical protein